MRLFVAVDIPPEVRRGVAALAERLRAATGGHRGFRWVRAEGMHVTLKFIGATPAEKAGRIRAALEGIRLQAPVEMTFRGAGFFPNERRARVFWAGIEATANLAELAAAVEQRLEPLGVPREARPFRPHLTLARIQEGAPVAQLLAALEAGGPVELGAARAAEMHLYQSVLRPGGAEYTRLATFVFAGEARR